MNILLIRELVRIGIGAIGLLSVYCGYRLFCEIPFARSRTAVHVLSGALLAFFGVAILIADFGGASNRVAREARPGIQQTRPAEAGSFAPHTGQRRPSATWTI